MEDEQKSSVGNMDKIYIVVIDKKGQWRAICVLFYM